jgi:hypothetical protein
LVRVRCLECRKEHFIEIKHNNNNNNNIIIWT